MIFNSKFKLSSIKERLGRNLNMENLIKANSKLQNIFVSHLKRRKLPGILSLLRGYFNYHKAANYILLLSF